MSKSAQTQEILKSLKLNGIYKSFDYQIEQAEKKNQSYLSFLYSLLNTEMKERSDRRYRRNLTGAHFPSVKALDNYNFESVKGVNKAKINQLLDFRWIDNHKNILFFGPPGLGKTHLSIALGMEAIKTGYTVCFERITNLIKLLKTAEIQRSSVFRLNRIMKSELVIIDEIGYTPIEKKEANLFFNLISELYEKSSIIITSNKGFDQWAEMMGDQIMTTALLDRLLHHAEVFNLKGESYRLKKGEQ
jgi:DNA replication protein DnaC